VAPIGGSVATVEEYDLLGIGDERLPLPGRSAKLDRVTECKLPE